MTEEIHDHTRVDAFMAARRRAMVLHAVWRPMLAGAVGAALVIAAVWVVLPKVSYREIVVDHVIQKDVSVDHVVPHDVAVDHVVPHTVEIEIPRIVVAPAPSPLARTPDERRFTADSPGWRESVVKGRILRSDGLGFVMLTESEGEQRFAPAKVSVDGQIVPDPTMRDDVSAHLGALAYCRPQPAGIYQCTALGRDGREVPIPEVPAGQPL